MPQGQCQDDRDIAHEQQKYQTIDNLNKIPKSMQIYHPELILIVDDNPTNLEVMSEALSDAGYDIAIATSGERAIKQIQRSQPDLILLDVMMPGINGFQACQIIREEIALIDIPIIFMTALADTENKVKGLEFGAVDYITKPFQEAEVLARVKTHLRLKHTEKRLRQSEERLESILNSLEEVVWSATLEPFNFLYLNPAVEEIFGYSTQELRRDSQLWFDVVHPDDKDFLITAFEALQTDSSINLEYRIINASGDLRWLKVRAHRILEPERQGGYRIDGILHDISQQKYAETQLIHDAHHDNLTGLLNRNCFIGQTNQQLELLKTSSTERFAVLFIDLDRFKSINDSLGHHFGDHLLKKVAERIQESLRPSDIVARLGGDEFTILLKRVSHAADAIRVVERIHQKLSEPITLEGQVLFTTASTGIVLATTQYCDAEEILRDADIAMYQAKKQGKAGWKLFNQSMYDDSLRQLELERDLRLALDRQEITLNYQPIVNISTQQVIGFEALARWIHPERGFISPGDFIPIAEESGLIESLGEQILWQACHQLQVWKELYPKAPLYKMSINLSGKQLQSAQFISTLDHILEITGISGNQLKLEITESILLDHHESLLVLLQEFLNRNIALSLDDFGTGYSSLSYLHRFPLNELKIDRSFINRIETDQQCQEIVKTIITLAQTLNMNVVAEGVETQEQIDYLQTLNCNVAQGYFFAKPLPSIEAELWVKDCTRQIKKMSQPMTSGI